MTVERRPSATGSSLVDRIRKNQTPRRRSVSDALARLYDVHLPTAYERLLNEQLDALLDSIAIELDRQQHAAPGKSRGGRVLLVTGEAGVGKSWTLAHLLATREELQVDEASGETPVFLSITAPSPFTLGALGNETVRALGYDSGRDIPHSKVWPVVRGLLAEKQIRILHIDEAQHGDEIVGVTEAQVVENTLKRLLQDPDWTVWLILSGLPELARFCQSDPSMRRRVKIVKFELLRFPEGIAVVRGTIERLRSIVPELDCLSVITDEFANRLIHAAMGSYGVLIEYVVDAIAECLTAGVTVLSIGHFADAYSIRTGVTDDGENVFVARDFTSIPVSLALFEDVLDDTGKTVGRKLKKRRRKDS